MLAHFVEHSIFHDSPTLQMLDDNALEQLRGDARVPHTFRIDHNDGTSCTYAKTRRFAALDPARPEQKSLTLKE
jgi:hypothetical protein